MLVVLFNPCQGDKEFHNVPKSNSQKVIVIVWLEFELTYYDVEEQ